MQKVSLASYHLEGEANQWWQWIRRTFQEEGRVLSWINFEGELWARFGPSKCEDFDEALSRIRQEGSLRDYQREFERLGNRVRGWTQRALVGTFMGGLKRDISDGIRMFKPQTLKEAISLAWMTDDQFTRQRRFIRLVTSVRAPLALPLATKQHSQPLPILSDDSHGKKCSGGEPKIYVSIVMNDLLQDTSVRGHAYLCWKVAMTVILSYVTMILKNN
jgi:hypothetical protein